MKADRTKSTGKAKSKSTVKKGLYDGVADPNKKVGDYTVREVTEGAKNTVKAAAADALTVPFKLTKKATKAGKNQAKRALNAATLGIFEDYLKTEKKMGGVAKPSYKKGGYMMNTKKKKK
jgi:hypothetical protein